MNEPRFNPDEMPEEPQHKNADLKTPLTRDEIAHNIEMFKAISEEGYAEAETPDYDPLPMMHLHRRNGQIDLYVFEGSMFNDAEIKTRVSRAIQATCIVNDIVMVVMGTPCWVAKMTKEEAENRAKQVRDMPNKEEVFLLQAHIYGKTHEMFGKVVRENGKSRIDKWTLSDSAERNSRFDIIMQGIVLAEAVHNNRIEPEMKETLILLAKEQMKLIGMEQINPEEMK